MVEHVTYMVAIDAGNEQQWDADNDMIPCPTYCNGMSILYQWTSSLILTSVVFLYDSVLTLSHSAHSWHLGVGIFLLLCFYLIFALRNIKNGPTIKQ